MFLYLLTAVFYISLPKYGITELGETIYGGMYNECT
jgi:hypothetical protein